MCMLNIHLLPLQSCIAKTTIFISAIFYDFDFILDLQRPSLHHIHHLGTFLRICILPRVCTIVQPSKFFSSIASLCVQFCTQQQIPVTLPICFREVWVLIAELGECFTDTTLPHQLLTNQIRPPQLFATHLVTQIWAWKSSLVVVENSWFWSNCYNPVDFSLRPYIADWQLKFVCSKDALSNEQWQRGHRHMLLSRWQSTI